MKVLRLGTILAIVWMSAGILAAEPAPEPVAEATPEPGSEELLAFTGRFETVGGSELFASDFDWVLRRPERVVTLGLSSSRIDDRRWLYAKAGVARKVSDRILLSAAVDLGEGESAGSSFGYRKVGARVTHMPLKKRLQLYAEAQSYEVEKFHGTLLSAGVSYRFEPAVAVGMGYSELVAGNSESRIVFGRIDLERALGYFVGFAHGSQAPGPAQVVLGLQPDADYREIYAGVSAPIRGHRLLVFLDLTEQGETRRRALVASWRLRRPVGKQGLGG